MKAYAVRMTDRPEPKARTFKDHKFVASNRKAMGSRCQICGKGSFQHRPEAAEPSEDGL